MVHKATRSTLHAALPSIVCGALSLTAAALSAGCVELEDTAETAEGAESTETAALAASAETAALAATAASVLGTAAEEVTIDPDAPVASEEEALANPGFLGEPGAMLVRDLEGTPPAFSAAAAPAVTLYKDVRYSGSSSSRGLGVYDVGDFGLSNDSLSSLRIPAGLTARLYQHDLYGGGSTILSSDTPDLRDRGFNDKTSSIAIHGPITEPAGVPYHISSLTGAEDLKFKVASDPNVIMKLATFASMLGYGWCGGTQTPWVGENFDVYRNSDGTYTMQAHYNKNDPYADGYWADKRLKITLSNFKLGIDPSTFSYGTPLITSLTPVALDTALATNSSMTPSTISVMLNSSHTDSYTHETQVSFTQGLSVSVTSKAMVPFGEVGGTTELSVSSTQGWTNSTSTIDVIGSTFRYDAEVPGRSQKLITMVGLRTRSNVDYSAVAYVTFDVSFYGFLRWGGNGYKDHPTNRPFVTTKFGNSTRSGFEAIVDIFDHSYIPNYSEWDWHWIKAFGHQYLGSTIGFFRRGITVPLNGRFTGVRGTNVTFQESAATPLPDPTFN